MAALRDAHQEVRRASVRTLARIGGPDAARALVETSSQDVSPAVRAEAVAALGRVLAARAGGRGGTEVSEPGKAPQ
jgi:HEAT repeat protein